MKVAVTYPDVEHLVVDYLAELIDSAEARVGVGVPAGWTPSSTPHVQVALDGTPNMVHPIAANHTIRLVARAATTSAAKALAMKAHGLLLAHPGGDGIASTRALTGVFPAHDSKTNAEIASVTARVTVRAIPLELNGS